MSQTHIGPREDAAKKRREYLWRKAGADALICVGLVLFLVFGFLTLAVGAMTAVSALLNPAIAVLGLIVTAIPGSIAYLACRTILHTHNRAEDIPYVPPVAEQIAALPADEVLLRGSDQPAAAPAELLRAAQEGTETALEELLRPDQMRSAGVSRKDWQGISQPKEQKTDEVQQRQSIRGKRLLMQVGDVMECVLLDKDGNKQRSSFP